MTFDAVVDQSIALQRFEIMSLGFGRVFRDHIIEQPQQKISKIRAIKLRFHSNQPSIS